MPNLLGSFIFKTVGDVFSKNRKELEGAAMY
jgi:hypothetical protein